MIRQVLCAVAMLAAFAFLLTAQTIVTGEIAGSVSDPSGASVANGKIALKSDATGQLQSAVTGATGEFHFSLLRPGTYTLTVAASGFEETTQRVTVNLGQVSSVKVQLGLQRQNQSVTVSEQAVLTQTDNANLATTFNSVQLENLPAPGNDMTAYAFTTPGVSMSTGAGYGSFTAFGLPAVSNLFTINGSDNMDPYLNLNNSGASNLTLGSNEIQEAAVVINGYTGQYGRQAGAQVNYVTKSGGNDFHGNASFYYNERVLNANDFFNNATGTDRPFSISREWAGSIGGRIIKNKLFFYYDNEGLRYVLPGGGPVYIPTPDFSAYVLNNLKTNNAAAAPFYTTAMNLYSGASGASHAAPLTQADDPYTTPGNGGLGCGDFAGTAGWGSSKPCAATFRSSVNNLNVERLQAGKVDYNPTDKDRIYVRYNDDHGVQATGTDPINPIFNANSVQPSYGGQVGYTRVISSAMVNQFIATASYYSAIFGPPDIAASLKTFPTTWAFADGAPFSNMGGSDNSYPQGRKVRQHQFIDDFSVTHGTHVFKAGLNLRQNWVSSYAYGPNTSGLFTFNSMTDFVNGSLDNGSQYSQAFARIGAEGVRMYSIGFYVQDEWKVIPKLTLTLALRMDRNSNISCAANCFNEFGVPFSALSHNAATPYNAAIQTNLGSAFPGVQSIVPEPRIGFAYSATPTTVIRGGFGIFTDLYQGLIADRFIVNSPAVASFTTSSGLVALGNPKSAQAAVANSASAFQSGFASGATLAQLQASVPGFAKPNFNTVANELLNPKYYEWNLEVQQAFAKNYVLSVNYVGNHGVDEINQTLFANAYAAKGFAGLPATVPDSRFAEIRELNNQGYSYYDGLVTTLKARISTNLSGQFSYTWGHALDTLSNGALQPFNASTAVSLRYQIDPLSLKALNYGNADYDTRRSMNGNLVYTIPSRFHSKLANHAFGGWTVAGTVISHSAYPFSIVNSSVRSTQGISNASGLATVVVLADFLGGSSYPSCTTPNVSCYSKSMFATTSAQKDWGNIPRNSFRGPGYFNTDLNIKKTFTYRERYKLDTGAYFFNLFNHPNFDLPANNLATGTFGQILSTVSAPTSAYGSFQGSAVSGRVVQLVVKFSF